VGALVIQECQELFRQYPERWPSTGPSALLASARTIWADKVLEFQHCLGARQLPQLSVRHGPSQLLLTALFWSAVLPRAGEDHQQPGPGQPGRAGRPRHHAAHPAPPCRSPTMPLSAPPLLAALVGLAACPASPLATAILIQTTTCSRGGQKHRVYHCQPILPPSPSPVPQPCAPTCMRIAIVSHRRTMAVVLPSRSSSNVQAA